MEISLYDIVYLFANLFSLYIFKRFMLIFFPLKQNAEKMEIGAYTLYFIGTSFVHFYIDIPVVMLIANLVLLFIIARCYEASMKKQILAVIYIYFVAFAAEVIFTALTMAKITPLQEYGYSNISGLVICKILFFFIVLLIENIVKVRSHHSIPLWLFLTSTSIPITTIVIELLFFMTTGVSQSTIVISVVVIFFINTVVFFLYDSLSAAYDRQLKAAVSEQERTYYYNQCILMQESAEDVRAFKHDMNNHLSLLKKFMDDDKIKETKAYINELVREHRELKTLYCATGNVAIDSILNYKLGNISNPDLNIDVQANVPTELAVEIVDLSIILTNLLDNAITAIANVMGNCQLSVRISYQKGMLLIHVSNSYNGNVQYENGVIVTTKQEKKEHGRGLYNIRKAAEKYQGTLYLEHNSEVFTAEVILYVSSKS